MQEFPFLNLDLLHLPSIDIMGLLHISSAGRDSHVYKFNHNGESYVLKRKKVKSKIDFAKMTRVWSECIPYFANYGINLPEIYWGNRDLLIMQYIVGHRFLNENDRDIIKSCDSAFSY